MVKRISLLICEECNEPIHRLGNKLYCENGCYEEDIRNLMSEDNIEEIGIESEFILPCNEEEDFVEIYSRVMKKKKK
jgi:hypothetical protein